jgi:hypothetical protein
VERLNRFKDEREKEGREEGRERKKEKEGRKKERKFLEFYLLGVLFPF